MAQVHAHRGPFWSYDRIEHDLFLELFPVMSLNPLGMRVIITTHFWQLQMILISMNHLNQSYTR